MTKNRHVFAALALVAAVSLGVVAGSAHAGGILGGRIGASVASIDTDASSILDTENQTGFVGSVFWQTSDGNFSLQPELSYIEKGAKDGVSGESLDLAYAELAGLVKFGIPIWVIKPHIFGGIGADFEVSSDSPVDVDLNSPDLNAIFGLDVMFQVGSLFLVGDARYAMGLNDITDAESAVGDLKNRAWLLSAGVGFKM